MEQTLGLYPGCNQIYEKISAEAQRKVFCLDSELLLSELAELLGGGK